MAGGVLKKRWGAVRPVVRRWAFVALTAVLMFGCGAASAPLVDLLPGGAALTAAPALSAPFSTHLSVVSVRGGYSERLSVTVAVTNDGAPFVGWLEVSGTERRVLVAVDVPAGSSRLAAAAYPVDNRGNVRVRLLDADEEPMSARISAVVDYVSHVLVVGERRAGIAEQLSQAGWLVVDEAPAPPADPSELDLYTYLVVAGDDPASSSAAAQGPGGLWAEAGAWVSRGGALVVAGPSAASGAVTDDVLQAEFAPSRVLGAATELTVVSIDGIDRGSIPLPAGTSVTPVTPAEAGTATYTVALDDGTLVLAGARLGQGVVLFVGVAPSTSGPVTDEGDAVRFFWENLVLNVPQGEAYLGAPWTDPPHLFVTGRVPSLVTTGVASLLYVGVVGVGLFVVLRRVGRRDAVWWVVPALVVTTTLAVLGAGLIARGARQEVLIRRTISFDAGDSVPTESLNVGAYAPFGARFGVALPSGLAPGTVEGYDSGFASAYTIRDATPRDGPLTLEDVRVAPGAGRSVSLRAHSDVRAGGGSAPPGAMTQPLTWSNSGEGDVVRWTVTNMSGDILRRVIVVANGVYTLPDLAPSGSVVFTVGPDSVSGESVTALTEEPDRPDSRDYLEWEAESRLRAEWAQYGQWGDYGEAGTMVVPPPGAVEGKGFGASGPMPAGIPVRMVAFADDRGPLPVLSGLAGDATTRSVVVYEVVLR
ncbi:MAG: hypothetical protein ACYCX3_01880 [Thermoleophilia bacterium]